MSQEFELPAKIASACARYGMQKVDAGRSAVRVMALMAPERPPLYLKMAEDDALALLRAEHARLQWLEGKVPVPAVREWEDDGERAFLVLDGAPGRVLSDESASGHVPAVLERLAEALHLVHGADASGCPYREPLDQRLARARENVAAGSIRADAFGFETGGYGPEEVLDRLEADPPDETLVLTHGDLCLPNVLAHQGKISCIIDWPHAALRDYHADLADAVWSLGYNWGTRHVHALLDAYGREKVDGEKLAYYSLLRRFFYDDIRVVEAE